MGRPSGILRALLLMHVPALDNRPRHSLCPQCEGDVQGRACCLLESHGVRTIHYICTVCFSEWHHAVLLSDSPWISARTAASEVLESRQEPLVSVGGGGYFATIRIGLSAFFGLFQTVPHRSQR
jgi:hypothetical protein